MKPAPEMYLPWGIRRPVHDGGLTDMLRVKIADNRTVRVSWVSEVFLGLFTARSHDRIRYECGAWKLTLLLNMKSQAISLDTFEGDIEQFNRDTLHAKLFGVFDF